MVQESVWPYAAWRAAVDGLTPEQAVDEAIARVKQLLREQPAIAYAAAP
jgi:hypothetical protein